MQHHVIERRINGIDRHDLALTVGERGFGRTTRRSTGLASRDPIRAEALAAATPRPTGFVARQDPTYSDLHEAPELQKVSS